MACQIQASRVSPALEIDKGLSFMINVFHSRRRASSITLTSFPYPMKSFQMTRPNRKIAFALDTGSSVPVPGDNDGGGQEMNGDRTVLGSTRLGRIAIAGGKQLLGKINSARKNFPMKIFLLLLGFYTANALATILGQTGDWDVLVAGIVVAAIEGIGMLMYKRPSSSMFSGKLQSFVVFMNFWKAGVCLGLFVDAFKLGS
ncbi:PREDICTED: ycf20-like protein [Camelina sativa]|uniref:Ycf20-like protein n=1 Tax=Camelina sativa TaxID=90675 RepID=A0ABM0Z7B0_CAMSA|nr:PREDICTED: ycf20-like protein [Camelina sativa]